MARIVSALEPDFKWGVDEPFQFPLDVREWLIGFNYYGRTGPLGSAM
jgi:hypothetical protein